MFFQEPLIDFIMIESTMVTVASNGIKVCQGGIAKTLAEICADMEDEMDPNEYCDLQESGSDIAYVKNTSAKLISEDPVSKEVQNAVPAATAAPVRSAPHFNNNLFN